MNKRKGDEEHRDREHREKEYHEGERHREKPRAKGRERQVHLDYLLRRWLGSAPPTAEAYNRALKQWRQLPGSIVTATTDVGETEQTPPRGRSKASHRTRGGHTRGGERSHES